jgi:hypothetical protein
MRRWLSLPILLLASAASAAGLDARSPDVGPVKADGQVDDLPALKRACAMAQTQNRRLDLPAGKIRIVLPVSDQGYGIQVTGPLDIAGEGRDETILAIEPGADRGNVTLFSIPDLATGYGLTLSHLTATCAGDPTPAENRFLVWHRGPRASDLRTWLRVNDVTSSGGWTSVFFMDSGTAVTGTRVHWTFRDCDIGAKYGCLFFYGLPERSRYLDVQGCTFASGTPAPDSRGNCLYISPQCSVKVIGCTFRKNARCALKYAGVNAAGKADHGVIANCTFNECTGAAIEVDKFSTPLVSGCVFGSESDLVPDPPDPVTGVVKPKQLDRAIVHFGGVKVADCVSYARAFLSPSGASAKDALIEVANCRMIGCTQVMAGAADPTNWVGTRWRFSGCEIRGGTLSTGSLFVTRAADEWVEIVNCRIDVAGLQSVIVANSSTFRLRNTSISGTTVRGALEITTAPQSVDVRDCEFAMAASKAVFWASIAGGMPKDVIRGRGNRKTGPLSEIRVQANPVLEQDWRDDSGTLVPFASSTGSLP